MIGKGLKKALIVFYIINIFVASVFFILSLSDFFVSEPSSLTLGSFALLILMRLPFYISLIPLITFLMWNRLNSILVGIITILWFLFLIFIIVFISLMYTYANDPNFYACARGSEIKRDSCYGNKALEESIKIDEDKNGDIERIFTFCQKIVNTEKRMNCFDLYYYEKAQQEANLEICKQIFNEQFKDTCFFRVIIDSKKEENLCNNIQDENKRESCFVTLNAGKS
mgnify:FL=1